jgi:hypothetical protein
MITVDIASGASLSAAIPLGLGRAAGIQMPAAWTAANLTFQASYDGITYANLYDASGTEYTATAAADRLIILPVADFAGIQNIKIRSGTAGTPVNQAAARRLDLQTIPF